MIEVSRTFCFLASQINQAISVFSRGILSVIYIHLTITFCFSQSWLIHKYISAIQQSRYNCHGRQSQYGHNITVMMQPTIMSGPQVYIVTHVLGRLEGIYNLQNLKYMLCLMFQVDGKVPATLWVSGICLTSCFRWIKKLPAILQVLSTHHTFCFWWFRRHLQLFGTQVHQLQVVPYVLSG